MSESTYDVVVVGAGPTGENVADRARRGGLTVAVVEAERVGGECSFWACIPSKALLRPAQALAEARAVEGASAAVTGSLDVAAVLARRDRFVHDGDDGGQADWLTGVGADLVRGHGRLAGERRVTVTPAGPGGRGGSGDDAGEDVTLVARHAVVLATGTRASVPPVPGLAEARPWTSREATTAASVPGRLVVLGGGVVACEMATAYAQLGAAVTVLQRGPGLLAGVPAFAGEAVAASLRGMGVEVLTGTEADRVTRRDDGTVEVVAGGRTIEADEVLVAAGRTPNTGDLGLDTVGLQPGGWLDVDDHLAVTGVDGGWLYAAGDLNHRALLTHMGKYQARVCGDVVVARASGSPAAGDPAWGPWGRLSATADDAAVPQVVFTMPEVAAVGLNADQARARGLDVTVASYDLADVGGASLWADDYAGRAEAVVDTTRRVLVGLTLVGPNVGEMVHAATVAVVGEVPLDRLWHAVPSFPTVSELYLRLLEDFGL
jgi:pyruvate/2-oxoglutarate dehydrogenase complex dihydrolipoamide dehydrogenase (E3) component